VIAHTRFRAFAVALLLYVYWRLSMKRSDGVRLFAIIAAVTVYAAALSFFAS
jgi:hypothetical protein